MPTDPDDQPVFDAVAFGLRIAQRRKRMRIPQDRLAEAVGISRFQLQNLEHGWSDRAKRTPANPQLSTLIGLCRELGGRIDVVYPAGLEIVFDEAES